MRLAPLLVLTILSWCSLSFAQTRHALVMGVWDYTDPKFPALPGIQDDVKKMSAKLKELGFEVTEVINPTLGQSKKAVDDFGDLLQTTKGVGLFYFSGHGCENDGNNFLIPKGTAISKRSDLDDEALPAQRVLLRMEESGAAINLVFLDCCRNALTKSAANGGLASMEPTGTFIGYATASAKVAGATDTGSAYTNVLLEKMSLPGISISDMHTQVTREVLKVTEGDQRPFQYSGLDDVFYFVPGRPGSMPGASPAPVAKKAGSLDTTFGGTGVVTFPVGPGINHANSVSMLKDGSVILTGESEKNLDGKGYFFALAKLLPSGMRDRSFGESGRAQFNIGPYDDGSYASIAQPNGRIVLAGRAEVRGYGYDFGLMRVMPDGSPHSSFGKGGRVTTNFGNGNGESADAQAVALQSDGKILAAGKVNLGGKEHATVVRYLPDGSLDTSFATGGKLVIRPAEGGEFVVAITQRRDGTIVFVTVVGDPGKFRQRITCLESDGKYLSGKFGKNGAITPSHTTSNYATMMEDSSGRILIGGGWNARGGILALTPDGRTDADFGTNGIAYSPDKSVGGVTGLVEDRKGRILASGSPMSVLRILPNGRFDSSFGENGVGKPPFAVGGGAMAIAVDFERGHAVVVGHTNSSPKVREFTAGRFHLD